MAALAMIARGDTLSQVAGHLLTDYGVKISETGLSQIKKAHKNTVIKMQETIADGKAAEADDILARSRRLVNRRLDKAERDERAVEELDQKYRDGEIKSPKEYRRRKAGLLRISIAELLNVSRTMHSQAVRPIGIALSSGDPADLPSSQPQTPAQLEAILLAIQAGNTVELQRLIFTPGGQARERVESNPA